MEQSLSPFLRKMVGLLRLLRFELPLLAGICTLLGELLALGTFPTVREVLLGFGSVFFISASALTFNDYFDLEIDRINAPERPLPSGIVTSAEVIGFSIFITLLGLALSAWGGTAVLLLAVGVWLVGFLYNWRLKRAGLLGNVMVALSVGMTFIYGGVVVDQPLVPMVWFFAAIALLIDLGEEIAADAMDMAGDEAAGSRSLAVRLGPETAIKISGGLFLLVVLLSSLPFLFGWLDWVFVWPLLLMDGLILTATRQLLNPHTQNRRTTIRQIYLGAGLALIILLLMLFLR